MLAAFEKKLRAQGRPFVMIGIERQNSDDAKILSICKEKGVEFTITSGGDYPGGGGGLPQIYVFDHLGKMVYGGRDKGEAEAAVEKALVLAPNLYAGEGPFVKLKAVAAQIEKKASLGAAAAGLRKKLDSEDAGEKAEAETLLKVLTDYAAVRQEGIEALKSSDPEAALADLKTLGKEFSGDVLGTEANEAASKLSADPEFKKLKEGFKKLAEYTKNLDTMPPCKACKGKSLKTGSLACASCKEANAALLAQMKKALTDLAKKHEGNAVAAKASEAADRL